MPASIFFSDCDALCTFANSSRGTVCVVLVSTCRCVGPNCPLPCAIRFHSHFTYTLHYLQGLLVSEGEGAVLLRSIGACLPDDGA